MQMATCRALIAFDPDLRTLLPAPQRSLEDVPLEFKGSPGIKHEIESLGVPHTEVGSLRVNGLPAALSDRLHDGDRVAVRGVAPAQGVFNGRGQPCFIADNHLGRLAAYLRMLGYDTLYRNDYQDPELAAVAHQEERILLTRDRRLLMRREVAYGCLLRSLDPQEQLDEVVQRYALAKSARPFLRCLRCNHLLEAVDKADVLDRLQPLTRRYFEEFARCPACDQIYWKGSHYDRMLELIEHCNAPHP